LALVQQRVKLELLRFSQQFLRQVAEVVVELRLQIKRVLMVVLVAEAAVSESQAIRD
jgi:hypothetical protein